MNRTLLIFIISALLVVGIIAFIFSNQRIENEVISIDYCNNIEQISEVVGCEDASVLALSFYDGLVNGIKLQTTEYKEGPDGEPRDIQVWLIDINLKIPIETPVGEMKRIVIAVDVTSELEPFIEKFFPEAL